MVYIAYVLFWGGAIGCNIFQWWVVYLAFKVKFSAGMFCLFCTPVYAFTSNLREDEKIKTITNAWLVSAAAFGLGTLILVS